MDEGALTGEEAEFWRAFLAWSQGVRTTVNRAVTEAADLSVPEFEVLDRLHARPHGRTTQVELTVELGWSASRISHLLTRLEERRFIRRGDAGRGRVRTAELTPAGAERLSLARAEHGQAVRAALLDQLDAGQREMLRAVMAGESAAG